MSVISIPDWSAQGVIPPVDVIDPASANRSPYRVSLTDLVLRFDTSEQRRGILAQLMQYRAALHAVGLTLGFQWVDGSFLEQVEVLESRPPSDLDVVTFYQLAPGATQADVLAKSPDLFDHDKVKASHHVDAYLVSLQSPAENLIEQSVYWYSVWSHRRDWAWKGYVQVDLAPADDAAAIDLLKTPPADGGTP